MPQRVEALINPTMLSWVRTQEGYAPDEMARKAGTTESRYRAWEQGAKRPTLQQVFHLAYACRRPVSLFYFDQPPPAETMLPDFRRLRGTQPQELSPPVRLEIRLAKERRQAFLELVEKLGGPPDLTHWRYVNSAAVQSDAQAVARQVRELLGISLQSQLNWGNEYEAFHAWKDAIERAGMLVFQCSLELQELRAAAIVEVPYPALLLNTKDSAKARIFSLLHEVGHVFLGQSALSSVWDSDYDVERYCNHLAAEVLLPRDALRVDPLVTALRGQTASMDDLRALSRKYWVSMYAVVIRLVELRLQPDALRRRYEAELRRESAAPIPSREGGPSYYVTQVSHLGAPLVKTTLRAADEDVITAIDAARVLGVRAQYLEKLREHV